MNFLSARTLTLAAGLLLCTGSALAQDRVPLEKSRTASGTIAFIQKETRQFVLKGDDNANYIFTLDERTSIRENDKDVRLLDMGAGMKVTVTYTPGNTQFYAASVVATGKKTEDTAIVPEKPREASPLDAEPITVKGKIEKVASDLAEVTVRTFDDKVLTFSVDDDTRQRFKNKVGKVPDLSPGAEVTVVYLIQNGRNRLVTLSDLVQPEPSTGGTSSANNATMPRNNNTNNRSNTNVTQPNVNVQTGVTQPPFGGLPLITGGILPGGFVATTNNVAGSLNGTLAMVQRDMLIVSTAGGGGPITPQPMNNNSNSGTGTTNNNTANNNTNNTANLNPARADLFAVLAVNSKEPFILDGATRILSNNQPIRWQNLREGTLIQAHFNASADGTKVVHTIIVMDNNAGNPGTAPMNPNNQPAARDSRGNPIQPNQVPPGGQQGTGVPPASQFPPLPGNTGNASNANPAGTQSPATNAANIISGRIARLKFDSLYLQRSGNDFSFLMTRNSAEPLRMDNGTRISVNGQEGNLANLQAGMQVHVFVEFVNNVRRVIGIAAGNQNVPQPNVRNP